MRPTHLIIAFLASIAIAQPSQTGKDKDRFSWSAPLARFYQAVDLAIRDARKSSDFPNPPGCDMSKASMPAAPSPLPSPNPDTHLRHVAIGRGVQNYTCADASPSSTPSPNGAIASLYNISCTECNYPELTTMMTSLVINYPLPSDPSANFQPTNILLSGHHFFSNKTTPIFDLDLRRKAQYGFAVSQKESATPAPSDAPKGLNGEAAVAWLKLDTVDGTTGGLKHIYRVKTVGGSPPETCEGMTPGEFSVQYAAQYWFYATNGS